MDKKILFGLFGIVLLLGALSMGCIGKSAAGTYSYDYQMPGSKGTLELEKDGKWFEMSTDSFGVRKIVTVTKSGTWHEKGKFVYLKGDRELTLIKDKNVYNEDILRCGPSGILTYTRIA